MSDLQCPERLRAAFLGEPTHVELPPGERLYKVVSIPIVRHRILESPWWIRQSAFDELRLRARRLQKPVQDLLRSQLAIAMEWNPGMDTLWVIVLGASVHAWEGRARSQRVSTGDGQVSFIGGGDQICVPGLDWGQVGLDYTANWSA
jgi:hypothetical protein